jgi:hypothetical protein
LRSGGGGFTGAVRSLVNAAFMQAGRTGSEVSWRFASTPARGRTGRPTGAQFPGVAVSASSTARTIRTPAAGALGAANAFHAAYWVIVAFTALGALTAAIAFPWRATRKTEPAPRRGVGSVPANG